MITKTFFNREEELSFLEEKYRSSEFQFIPIYGRRRIGKTELILQFIKDKKAIYFLATAGTKKENIERFKAAAKHLIDLSLVKDDWEAIFGYIKNNLKEKAIVVIDEFPYLVETEKGLSSIFQASVDLHLKGSGLFLVLCGSSLSMMYRDVLSYRAPLYGRRTGQIHLKELKFKDIIDFFEKPLEEIIRIYAICGGVPAYLNEFREKKPLFQLVEEKILAKNAVLREEVLFLLRQEFRDPKVYMAILSAISLGFRNLGKIINYCGLGSKTGIMPYLHTLESLGHIKREVSVTEGARSRKGLYFINDKFFEFWFKFVRRNYDLVERDVKMAVEKIRPEFDEHVGSVFENICKEALLELRTPPFTKIGRWWHGDEEIDIVALNEKEKQILFGECKWGSNVNAEKILRALKEKAELVEWHRNKRTEHYAVFAKSFKEEIQEPNVMLFDLERLGRIFGCPGSKDSK